MAKNQRSWILICVISGIILILVLFIKKNTDKTLILPNGHPINVNVADTTFGRTKGLMYRKHLDENSGMLFVFDDKTKHIFWMKNTLIALDIIWMDENLKIVDVTHNALPCNTKACQTYMPISPAKYALEVNGGYSERQNIKVGESLRLIE